MDQQLPGLGLEIERAFCLAVVGNYSTSSPAVKNWTGSVQTAFHRMDKALDLVCQCSEVLCFHILWSLHPTHSVIFTDFSVTGPRNTPRSVLYLSVTSHSGSEVMFMGLHTLLSQSKGAWISVHDFISHFLVF